jgi:hypothetical protein
MAKGRFDMKDYALPSYWDAAELEKWNLVDGTTYDGLVGDIGRALAIQNQTLLANPLIASLISTTTELATEYRVGVSNGFQVHTEYSRPDPQRGATSGHMLPIVAYDRGMGWTWDALRFARRARIDADIASAMDDLRNLWEQKILTRLFQVLYDAVGSAGRSMPIADGGTADASYIPIARPDRGAVFAYTHDHIHNLNGATQANIETAVANIWEHGHDAPYDMLISLADLAVWTAVATVTGWMPRAIPEVTLGSATSTANIDESYLGIIQTSHGPIRLRASARIPTTYYSIYKSYGSLDARNPLVVRYNPAMGLGAFLLKGDHIREFPLEDAILFTEFGVGVQDRVGATAYLQGAGGYTTPTIS